MEVVALDTNIFIYALEDNGLQGNAARALLQKISKETPKVYTSVITVEEVLIGVYKEGLEPKIPSYLEFIAGGGLITIVEVTRQIAMVAAKLRADYQVRTPDALQLATGLVYKATRFITADKRLPKKVEKLTIERLN